MTQWKVIAKERKAGVSFLSCEVCYLSFFFDSDTLTSPWKSVEVALILFSLMICSVSNLVMEMWHYCLVNAHLLEGVFFEWKHQRCPLIRSGEKSLLYGQVSILQLRTLKNCNISSWSSAQNNMTQQCCLQSLEEPETYKSYLQSNIINNNSGKETLPFSQGTQTNPNQPENNKTKPNRTRATNNKKLNRQKLNWFINDNSLDS